MFGNNRRPLVVVLLLIAMVGQLFATVVWACPMAEEHLSLEGMMSGSAMTGSAMTGASMHHETQNLSASNALDSESSAANCCQNACTVAGCMGVGLMTSAPETVLPVMFSLPLRSLVESFASPPPTSVYRPPILS